jgi:hypothetical protein
MTLCLIISTDSERITFAAKFVCLWKNGLEALRKVFLADQIGVTP